MTDYIVYHVRSTMQKKAFKSAKRAIAFAERISNDFDRYARREHRLLPLLCSPHGHPHQPHVGPGVPGAEQHPELPVPVLRILLVAIMRTYDAWKLASPEDEASDDADLCPECGHLRQRRRGRWVCWCDEPSEREDFH